MNTGAELGQYFCANRQFKNFRRFNWVEPPNHHCRYARGFHLVQTTRYPGINWDKMRSSLWRMLCAVCLLLKFKTLSQKFTTDIDIHWRNQQCIGLSKNVELQAACNLPHRTANVANCKYKEFESEGNRLARIAGKNFVVPLHFFGSTSTIRRFGKRFREYSLVSFLFCFLLLLTVPRVPSHL